MLIPALISAFYQGILIALFLSKIVQEKATNEKFILEEAQRKGHRERREAGVEWIPKLFERDPAAPNAINRWVYKYRE